MLSKHLFCRQRSLGSFKGSLISYLKACQPITGRILRIQIFFKEICRRLQYALRQITWQRGRQTGGKKKTNKKNNSKKLSNPHVAIRSLCTCITFLEPELAKDIPDVKLTLNSLESFVGRMSLCLVLHHSHACTH